MTTETKPITMYELKANISAAIASGDDALMNEAIQAFNKAKKLVAESLADAAKKENEALSGERAKLSESIRVVVDKIQNLTERLAKVKGQGFTYKPIGYVEADGTHLDRSSVSLTVPVIKTKKSGGTGKASSTGKSKDEYGMSLDEIYLKFAGDEEKADFAAVDASDKGDKAKNTAKWAIKDKVKRAAIKAGTLKPAS